MLYAVTQSCSYSCEQGNQSCGLVTEAVPLSRLRGLLGHHPVNHHSTLPPSPPSSNEGSIPHRWDSYTWDAGTRDLYPQDAGTRDTGAWDLYTLDAGTRRRYLGCRHLGLRPWSSPASGKSIFQALLALPGKLREEPFIL